MTYWVVTGVLHTGRGKQSLSYGTQILSVAPYKQNRLLFWAAVCHASLHLGQICPKESNCIHLLILKYISLILVMQLGDRSSVLYPSWSSSLEQEYDVWNSSSCLSALRIDAMYIQSARHRERGGACRLDAF